jgi:hypothetical protein
MTELLLGCGHSRKKQAHVPGTSIDWEDLITLDNNANCKPDIHCNLDTELWPCMALNSHGERATIGTQLQENYFAEVHAYEVLEHLGRQGDIGSFFSTFANIYRILLPGGYLFGTTPSVRSSWLWGDPGHRRTIQKESLIFLDQGQYVFQISKTPMSDYRDDWKGDFQIMSSTDDGTFHRFALQAIKPARI